MKNSSQTELLVEGLRIRRAEQLLLGAFKDGKIRGTIHTSLGQELIPIAVNEFFDDAFWFSNHRGHAHYLAKTSDFTGLFAEILGKVKGASLGVGGSQHITNTNYLSNGIQGGQSGIAAGVARSKLNPKGIRSVIFLGDGTLGAGHLYEAWNLAALYNSQTLFVVEDNQIAQSTPSASTFSGSLKQRAEGFGLKYLSVNDDNLSEMLFQVEESSNFVSNGYPTLLHVRTKRLGPHSKGDDNRSPQTILNLESLDLLTKSVEENLISFSDEQILQIEQLYKEVVEREPAAYTLPIEKKPSNIKSIWKDSGLSVRQEINSTLLQLMSSFDELIFLGEDVNDDQFGIGVQYGGAFKISTGISTKYPRRIISTPISESGFLGYAIGLALSGKEVIVELMFGDFTTQAIDQVHHQMSKIPSMYGHEIKLPIILRMAVGAGNGYGPTHSSFSDHFFVGLPNITVICVNVFTDYLEWANWSLQKKTPLVILEPKALYTATHGSLSSEIFLRHSDSSGTQGHLLTPENNKPSLTIMVLGGLIHSVLEIAEIIARTDEIFVNIFIPEFLDKEPSSLFEMSLRETNNNLLVIDESINGFGYTSFMLSEVIKRNSKLNFNHLHPSTWIPNGSLEDFQIPSKSLIEKAIREAVANA